MKKIKLVVTILVSIIALIFLYFVALSKEKNNTAKVAIVLTMSHQALDEVRAGILAGLPAGLSVIDYNAQGSLQDAHLIAEQIHRRSDVIASFAIGSLALKSLSNKEKTRPLIFAAVSDPTAILGETLPTNVAGLSDAIDASYQLKTIMKLLPELKTLALLYSPQEQNSESAVAALKSAAKGLPLSIKLVGVHDSQSIAQASVTACQTADAVLIPLDNQLVSAMPLVIKSTKNEACPIISSNEAPLSQGAAMAFGLDYKASGQKAAEIAMRILNEKVSPSSFGIVQAANPSVFINIAVLKEKGIKLPLEHEQKLILR
jgi:putative ABC transport system substrate-binding protein